MLESKYLKDNVQNIQKLMALPPLKKFETESLGQLARLSKIREYEPDETIIKEGEEDRWIYFLLSGKVRVAKQGVAVAVMDEEGALFGELSTLDGKERSASVTALTKTLCLAVDISASERLPSEDERTNFLLMLYRVFAEYSSIRLRSTTEELINAKQAIKILTDQSKKTRHL